MRGADHDQRDPAGMPDGCHRRSGGRRREPRPHPEPRTTPSPNINPEATAIAPITTSTYRKAAGGSTRCPAHHREQPPDTDHADLDGHDARARSSPKSGRRPRRHSSQVLVGFSHQAGHIHHLHNSEPASPTTEHNTQHPRGSDFHQLNTFDDVFFFFYVQRIVITSQATPAMC